MKIKHASFEDGVLFVLIQAGEKYTLFQIGEELLIDILRTLQELREEGS